MNKSKAKVREFIRFLYREYDVPRIPIHVHWYAKSIVVGDHACFCVCHTNDTSPQENEIHVCAGLKYGTGQTLLIIAHEFVHYLQWIHGRIEDEDIEDIAEENGQALVCKFLQNRRNYRGKHIDGVLQAWERR